MLSEKYRSLDELVRDEVEFESRPVIAFVFGAKGSTSFVNSSVPFV